GYAAARRGHGAAYPGALQSFGTPCKTAMLGPMKHRTADGYWRRVRWIGETLAALALLVGCGGREQPAQPPPQTMAPPPGGAPVYPSPATPSQAPAATSPPSVVAVPSADP